MTENRSDNKSGLPKDAKNKDFVFNRDGSVRLTADAEQTCRLTEPRQFDILQSVTLPRLEI
jgi:hypothetical protein